ncbi:GAF domain-containing sensor histidine kinase [Crocosphaera sp.]|uniref:GAF domain-containing sensor histidine kinase n=1 Tax=Crocosphaera sp. TaxID=2729996 RepID=UPI002636D9D9|nr:GAF domain-containing sensor histidine kinase [Crocosphaera sp.]MDJ0578793.1 GAF domain-containing sensor histidine kinase [Crocosphaera sp.]
MNNTINNQSLLTKLSQLSDDLASLSPHKFLLKLPDKICEILNVDSCILWVLNNKEQKLSIGYASHGVDDEYRKIELDLNHPTIKRKFDFNNYTKKNKVFYIKNIRKINFRLVSQEEIERRKWNSIATIVLRSEDRFVGLLDILIKENKSPFTLSKAKREILKILGTCTLSAIYKLESEDRQKLQKLINIMLEMIKKSEANEVWNYVEKGAIQLVSLTEVWVSKLKHTTGQLETANRNKKTDYRSSSKKIRKKKIETDRIGITGKAIKDEKPILVNDLKNSRLYDIYIEHNPDTCSELDIPIVVNDLPVRIGQKIESGSKCFGLINLESNKTNYFSENDRERLWLLARFAAIRLEIIESEQKFRKLRKIEKKILKAEKYEEIIKIIITTITDILKFTWINISLINSEQTTIKSEYVAGHFISKKAQEEFKQEVSHLLQDNDIQSDIVQKRKIEVIDKFDDRFDDKIYHKYKHYDLIRAFIPMIEPSTNLVIGTIEVGYEKIYRQYIYEEDIQIIKSLIDYSVNFLERLKAGMIDKSMHEFKSPIFGIKSNADFLLRHKVNDQIEEIDKQDKNYIIVKLNDILADAESLANQVGEIEYLLGTSNARELRFARTNVVRDIIVKTINQLSPTFRNFKLSPKNIRYNPKIVDMIKISTDRTKLNQVVSNLFVNAIKYSKELSTSLKKDPNKFRVFLEVEEKKELFIIKFQDWGIGINEEDCDRIFQQGFRSRQAQEMDVLGSGLGLSISKNIMKQLGGDLILKYNRDPTEFHLLLPKHPPKQ